MVLIELFDKTPIDNIITSLALRPSKVIFIGSDVRKAFKAMPGYEKIFKGRGASIELRARSVAKNDLFGTLRVLREVTSDPSDTYVIDVSGGDETSLVATGMLLRERDNGNISIFRINEISGRGVTFTSKQIKGANDVKIGREIVDYSHSTDVALSNEENVALHGGRITQCGIPFSTEDAEARDVEKMWRICRADCGGWNSTIGRLSSEISRYSAEGDTFLVSESSIGRRRDQLPRGFWTKLVRNGLVIPSAENTRSGVIVFKFKNKLVHECLTKAGSILEYYVYKTALETKENGVPVFSSANSGVVIGWDDRNDGTKNEIDVMLMHGVIPVFISCKNGSIKSDELYKLETVSRKFGSRHARSALASTVYFDSTDKYYGGRGESENLKKRAEVMGIRLLSDIHRMTVEELRAELLKLVK